MDEDRICSDCGQRIPGDEWDRGLKCFRCDERYRQRLAISEVRQLLRDAVKVLDSAAPRSGKMKGSV